MTTPSETVQLDSESQQFLHLLAEQEKLRAARVPGVKSVLVVLSSMGMVFDVEALRQKVLLSYPGAQVFFRTTDGKAIGAPAPDAVDLLIDFTGPRQKQGIFYAKKLRRLARVAAGRNAGFFRKKIYDRVFDEKAQRGSLPTEMLRRERAVQRAVLASVGVALTQGGDTPPDRGKLTPMELPPFKKL